MREPKDIIINGKTLAEILEKHKHWIYEDCEGCQGMKADLRGADLRDADLRDANLRGADINGADLRGADISGANISGADLREADISGASLREADIIGADLREADISGADLCCADISCAYLRGADLRGADISGANICGADLRDADISGAKYNENTAFLALQCPEEGSYIAWKKAGGYIIKLRITDDAKRSSATSRKCRASKAEVLEIQNIDGSKADVDMVCSNYNKEFIYKVGEIVEVNDFDNERWNECSTGIHHFITREEAVNY